MGMNFPLYSWQVLAAWVTARYFAKNASQIQVHTSGVTKIKGLNSEI
jgi:hypothetical protein